MKRTRRAQAAETQNNQPNPTLPTMVMSTIYTCEACDFKVDGWDDGNPYVEHPKGKRKYFYHPNDEDIPLLRPPVEIPEEASPEEVDDLLYYHTGNAPDHLCLKCGKISQIDPEMDKMITRINYFFRNDEICSPNE